MGSGGCRARIFHVNDVYVLDHLPALKTCVAKQSEGFPPNNVLTTLAGDFLGPSLLSSLDHGKGMVDCLNNVPVDVVCFGNHESDVPYQSLARRVKEFNGTWLNSNMPTFEPKCPAHACFQFEGGRSIAMIGLNVGGGAHASLYRRGSMGGHAANIVPVLDAVDDAVAAARAAYPGADCVVALTHQDMSDDVEMAKRGLVPVILGGHDHGRFDETHDGCRVVKAGEDARAVVVVDLFWPEGAPARAIPEVTVRFEDLAPPKPEKGQQVPTWIPEYAPDPVLLTATEHWMAPARELENATLAHILTEPPLTSLNVRKRPSTMAQLLATAVRDVVGADAAFMNAGGIRGNKTYDDGLITYAHLNAECPFPSSNVVIKIEGAKMSQALAQSRQAWLDERGPKEDGHAFQHDEGIEVDEKHEIVTVRGAPFDPQTTYALAVDAYMVRANPVLKQWAADHPELIPPDDAGRPALPILVQYFCDLAWHSLVDRDGDGTLDQAEIDTFFDEADKNGDGNIDEAEVLAVLKKRLGYMACGVVARQMLAIADCDQNGKVSKKELCDILLAKVKEHGRA